MRQECHRIVHPAPRRQSSGTDRRTYLAWLKVNRRRHRLGLGGPFPTPLSTPLRPAQGAIGRATLDEVTLGEHRHLVLQALCRGSVRRCQGAECAPCDAYIIAASRSGIPAALSDIFPGCRVVRWQPIQKALSGKVKEAAEFVINWFEKNPEGLLSFNIVDKAIGMDTQNFRKNVRRHPGFKEALANHDIAEAQELGDSRRGFLRPRFVEALSVE